MYSYINDKELRNYLREYCETRIIALQKELKEYFTFSFKLIGSGNNRLMMVNGKNNSVDLDYNLTIQRDKKQLFSNPEKIKKLFMSAFQKVCNKNVKTSDSTQVITCVVGKVGKYTFSFDIAIMAEGNDGYIYKIVNDKTVQPTRYIWNKIPKSKNIDYKFLTLKQNGYWEDIKEIYLEKKNKYLVTNNDKHSFSIFIETINEVIQKFHLPLW